MTVYHLLAGLLVVLVVLVMSSDTGTARNDDDFTDG